MEAIGVFPAYGRQIEMLELTGSVRSVKLAELSLCQSCIAGEGARGVAVNFYLQSYRFFERPEEEQAVVKGFQCSESVRKKTMEARRVLLR